MAHRSSVPEQDVCLHFFQPMNIIAFFQSFSMRDGLLHTSVAPQAQLQEQVAQVTQVGVLGICVALSD
jgi:hypothetical protein